MTSKKPMRVIFTRPSEIITRLSRIPAAKSRFGDSKQFNTHVPCRTLLWLSPSAFPNRKDNSHFKPAKLVIKWGLCFAAIHAALFRLSLPRGG